MSMTWQTGDDAQTEYDHDWRDLAHRVRESSERELEWRYRATERWIASVLTVALAVLAGLAWLEMPW